MADIYLGRDALEGRASRHVVIKLVKSELVEDEAFAQMFLEEGQLHMHLSHPNLCSVYECGRHDGRFYMAMEFVNGQTLREVLVRAAQRGSPLPIPVLLKVFSQIAEALESAHRARDPQGQAMRIVHRDVSPHNIMVRFDGVVKLLDFGVAKAERQDRQVTEAGALKGKFSYMAPEQARAEPLDHRADIFSLGICIFEAVTGRRLFHRKRQYDTLTAILEQDPPPLNKFRDDIPEGLEEIVSRALQKAPDDRYERAAELHHDLERLLSETREIVSATQVADLMSGLFEAESQSGPVLEVSDEIRQSFAPPEDSLTTGDEAAEPSGRTPQPDGRLFMALAVVLALAAFLGGWLVFRGMSSSAPDGMAEDHGSDSAAVADTPPDDSAGPTNSEVVTPTEEPTSVDAPSPSAEEDAPLPSTAPQAGAGEEEQPPRRVTPSTVGGVLDDPGF